MREDVKSVSTRPERSIYAGAARQIHSRTTVATIAASMDLSKRVHPSLRPFMRTSPTLLPLILIAILFLLLLPTLTSFSRPPCPPSTSSDLISLTSARPLASLHPTHLVIVAGHAIFTGPSYTASALATESNWALEPYQTGFVATFLSHIRRGIDLARASPLSILIFAGGATRASASPRTEAGTYFEAAASLGLTPPLRNRTHIEPFSRDSFENILFSICRFKQLSGVYPQKMSVVSFEFKRARFENLHRRALRFPRKDFTFAGIDPPPAPGGMRGSYAARERASTIGPFSRDPYGCRERVLRDKRVLRNAASLMFHPYPGGCEEIAPLFTYCGRTVFPGSLPWDQRDDVVDEIDASKVR